MCCVKHTLRRLFIGMKDLGDEYPSAFAMS